MTTPRADPHIQAFLAQLAGTGLPVGDGEAPSNTTGQYLVCYPDPGSLAAAAADGAQQDLTITVQVTACGPSRRDAGAAQDKARAALAGAELVVPGRFCWAIEQILAQPAIRDDAAKGTSDLPVYSAVAQYRWLSVPG